MYRYDVTGYIYGIGKPLDITWVGYNYVNVEKPVRTFEFNRYKSEYDIEIKQYYRNDGTLVLYFGPLSRYRNGFELYYQAHYANWKKGEDLEKYGVIATQLPNELD